MASHENQKRNNERSNELSVNLTKMDTNIKENLSDNFSLKCWLCKNNHRFMSCSCFKDKSISERRQFAKENKLCFKCLSETHIVKNIKSSFICREKNGDKKHTLLHEPPNVNVNNNFVNDLCTESENLQREVWNLENVENMSKTELSCNKTNKNLQ